MISDAREAVSEACEMASENRVGTGHGADRSPEGRETVFDLCETPLDGRDGNFWDGDHGVEAGERCSACLRDSCDGCEGLIEAGAGISELHQIAVARREIAGDLRAIVFDVFERAIESGNGPGDVRMRADCP